MHILRVKLVQIKNLAQRRGVLWWTWLTPCLLVVGDQSIKRLVQSRLAPAQSIPVIPNVFHLTYVQNTGAAFGLFRGCSGVFIWGSVIISAWILTELLRRRDHPWPMQVSLLLILGGAIGNLIDRVRVGYVIDFLDVRVWPVFNLADSAISVGVGLLLWSTVRRKR